MLSLYHKDNNWKTSKSSIETVPNHLVINKLYKLPKILLPPVLLTNYNNKLLLKDKSSQRK